MSGPLIFNRVKESSTTTGTGDITLGGAAIGFQSFSGSVGVGNTTYYAIQNLGLNEWEVGLGTLSGASTLQRTTVLASSNAGSAVNFSAGTKDVFVTAPASQVPLLGNANTWTGQQTFNTSAPIFGTTTSGSVLFAGAGGTLSQDNAKLYWDDTKHSLGVGVKPLTNFHFEGNGSEYTSNTVEIFVGNTAALQHSGLPGGSGQCGANIGCGGPGAAANLVNTTYFANPGGGPDRMTVRNECTTGYLDFEVGGYTTTNLRLTIDSASNFSQFKNYSTGALSSGVSINNLDTTAGNVNGSLLLFNFATTGNPMPNTGGYLAVVKENEWTSTPSTYNARISFYNINQNSQFERLRITSAGSVCIGRAVLGTTATDGFLYIPTCAGAPTGIPATQTGTAPVVYDTTNNQLCVYNGGWKKVTLA